MKLNGHTFGHSTELTFELTNAKLRTSIRIYDRVRSRFRSVPAIVDTGCTFVHVPKSVFLDFGYSESNGKPTKIVGINGISQGMSYVLDNFAMGDLELGATRVVVSELVGAFKNTVIIGMNVLAWFNTNIKYSSGVITLAERIPKILPGWHPSRRFTMSDPKHRALNELVAEAELDFVMTGGAHTLAHTLAHTFIGNCVCVYLLDAFDNIVSEKRVDRDQFDRWEGNTLSELRELFGA